MSRETQVETRLEADATLMATLTGGVHTSGALGPLGITRGTVPSAFDANGFLKVAALVRQRGLIPDGNVRDGLEQVLSTAQIVEIWVYADEGAGYSAIDSALDRIYDLMEGHQLSDAFPAEMVNRLDRERDQGALNNASMGRIDFVIFSVEGD